MPPHVKYSVTLKCINSNIMTECNTVTDRCGWEIQIEVQVQRCEWSIRVQFTFKNTSYLHNLGAASSCRPAKHPQIRFWVNHNSGPLWMESAASRRHLSPRSLIYRNTFKPVEIYIWLQCCIGRNVIILWTLKQKLPASSLAWWANLCVARAQVCLSSQYHLH